MDDMHTEKPNPAREDGTSNHRTVHFQKTFHWTGLSAFSKHVIHECGKIFEKPPWADDDRQIKAS